MVFRRGNRGLGRGPDDLRRDANHSSSPVSINTTLYNIMRTIRTQWMTEVTVILYRCTLRKKGVLQAAISTSEPYLCDKK